MTFPSALSSLLLILLLVFLLPTPTPAATPDRSPLATPIALAIDRGLTFLQSQQKPDGSFDSCGPTGCTDALATLAFLSAGHMPDVGKYGLVVRAASDRLVNLKSENGYLGRDGSGMPGHCIMTIALCQLHGAETDDARRKKAHASIEKALRIILAAQDQQKDKKHAGGWRNEPNSSDSDLPSTAWCLLALHAARGAGFPVPREHFDRGLAYVLRCYRPAEKGFGATPSDPAAIGPTAAALLCLTLLDAADREEAAVAARFIAEKPLREGAPQFYGTINHATHAIANMPEPLWQPVWKSNFELLLAMQRKDEGSWPKSRDEPGRDDKPGRVYSTALAVLTLTTPLRLLPVYEK